MVKLLLVESGKKSPKLAEMTKQEPLDKYIRMETSTIHHSNLQLKLNKTRFFKLRKEVERFQDDSLHSLGHAKGINMFSKRWPFNSYESADIPLSVFLRKQSTNKTTPQQILKAHIHILRAFIPLMDNSMNQLSRFQVVGELDRGGQKNAVPQGGQQKTNTDNKPASRPVQTKPFNTTSMESPTIQDVALRTQLILADFRSNVLNLASDLNKTKEQTCY
ncbi:hypothetical protein OS493_011866 [Desmophyllum pertusum]|uniref:Uncharacterized protein n=1 Tax=Desmophyllum pertusum TaxID=174260 RepID=A0A9W9YE00_9CNID|nr:hypothetical protein OS493_011866 [Desmophyllum pertusum]